MSTVNRPAPTVPLVDPGWLAQHLDNNTVRIVEVDVSAAAYDQGHVPGAVLWNAYTDLRHADYTVIQAEELELLFGACGIQPETTIAFYGYAAHLGYWLANAHGHTRAVIVDGPREQWKGAWTSETPAFEPTRYPLPAATTRVHADELLHLDAVVLDVRSESEYMGERFWPSGAPEPHGRPGHVPGAISLPITELRTDTGFRPVAGMQAALRRLSLTPNTPIATYCTIGNRASQAWYALTHLLGFTNVAVYDGGWAEWGTDLTKPIET